MFSLFKSQPFHDAQLGAFVRSRGLWRGTLSLDAPYPTPLALAGDRSRPDPQALTLARELPATVRLLRPAIEQALFEHYEPYGETAAAAIASPAGIWPHVTLVYVSVTPLGGVLAAELGYRVTWDEEHTLGARVRDGQLLELCGSVLEP
ncbi:MAG: hypothetical protein AB7G10_15175 [Reyranellaceae bacterium]